MCPPAPLSEREAATGRSRWDPSALEAGLTFWTGPGRGEQTEDSGTELPSWGAPSLGAPKDYICIFPSSLNV